MFITRQLKGLEDTKSAQFNRYFYLLEVCDDARACVCGSERVAQSFSAVVGVHLNSDLISKCIRRHCGIVSDDGCAANKINVKSSFYLMRRKNDKLHKKS